MPDQQAALRHCYLRMTIVTGTDNTWTVKSRDVENTVYLNTKKSFVHQTWRKGRHEWLTNLIRF